MRGFHTNIVIGAAMLAAACGGAPAVELSSPTSGDVVVSPGPLTVTTVISNFGTGTAEACAATEEACGRAQLVVDGRTCGTVETGATSGEVTILSDCPLTAGSHVVTCELYDHKENQVVAKSEPVEIIVAGEQLSAEDHRSDDDHHHKDDHHHHGKKHGHERCDDDDDDD